MMIAVATQQIAIRLEETVLAAVDDMVARGVFESRADAVRRALDLVIDGDEQRRIDEAYVAAYARAPQTAADQAAALESLRASILEEPW